MMRVISFVAALMFVPVAAAAQTPPPPPPTPPPAPASRPAPAPLPPLPPPMADIVVPPMIAPIPPLPPLPDISWEIEQAMREARDVRISSDEVRRMAEEAREAARSAMLGVDVEAIRDQAREAVRAMPMIMPPVAWDMDHLDFERPFVMTFDQSGDSGSYDSAKSALNAREYETAITRFDRVIAQKGDHTDAALYWKAFAQFKLGRMDDSLGTLQQLRRDHAQSRYLTDAKVLETDARRMSGQPVNPAALDDDEIKILAIQGIQRTDPERAIPLLEGVLTATNSLKVKRQALYVLALSDQPQAHQILMRYAKGAGNPDLQREAINYIASRRDKQTTSADLTEIYNSTQDLAVRLAIVSAYRSAGDKTALLGIAGNGSASAELRSSAISRLSGLAAPADIWTLYQKESDPDLKIRMLSALSSMSAVDQLMQAAKSERDAAVRQRAIRYLGNQKAEVTGQTLVDLYAANQDPETRKAVISALSSQNNAEGLVSIARKENSPELTREVVSRLASMAGKSKAAADYLAEIIRK